MNLSIGILMGLAAMACWGFADFMQAIIIKKIGSLKTMFFSNIISFIPTAFAFIFFLAAGRIIIDPFTFLLIFLVSFLDIIAIYNFLKSFEVGEISIVTPISASYSLVTVVLAVLFLGETLSFLKSMSILFIILGIVLVSTDIKKLKNLHTAKGVKESIIALLGWGVYFFSLGIVSARLLEHNLSTTSFGLFEAKISVSITLFFFTSLVNNIMMIAFSGIKGKINDANALKVKNVLLFLISNFILYTIAWASLNYGIAQDFVSLVAPISSLYPAITVMLAGIFLKEKLVLNQKIGILVVLLGIFLISL